MRWIEAVAEIELQKIQFTQQFDTADQQHRDGLALGVQRRSTRPATSLPGAKGVGARR